MALTLLDNLHIHLDLFPFCIVLGSVSLNNDIIDKPLIFHLNAANFPKKKHKTLNLFLFSFSFQFLVKRDLVA